MQFFVGQRINRIIQVKYAAMNEGDKDGIKNMFTGTYKDGLVDFSCDNSIDILGNIRSYGN